MAEHHLHWSHGTASVLTTAAMLASCQFTLKSGPFSPFARAPWLGQVQDAALSGHLRVLGGDFVGLPFGKGRAAAQVPAEWQMIGTGQTEGPVHGPAADQDWDTLDATDTAITLGLHFPASSPVLRVERRIAAQPNESAIDFTFTIFARQSASLPVGLHPILRLPDLPGRLHLSADFDFGMVHPGYGGQIFPSLTAIPQPGGLLDLSQVRLSPARELNVQLCGMRGPLRATYLDEGAGVELDWNRTLLPSLQIWHTDRGIGGAPWHNAYRGLGVEPIASAFDLGTRVSCGPNPINARGIATALQIDPAAPTVITHSIRAFAP